MANTTRQNGSTIPQVNGHAISTSKVQRDFIQLNLDMKNPQASAKYEKYHGDKLIGDKAAKHVGISNDLGRIFAPRNWLTIGKAAAGVVTGKGLMHAGAGLVGSMSNDSDLREKIIEDMVKQKYDRMLHPPLTYLGDAFQYRQQDGKYNSVLSPHLGQAGAPYAKTVPSKTHPLGALPDPGDLFDRLMARQDGGRDSGSGLSAMLIYHATLIIHDIFRTNDNDKNISDSSSYLDLSPLYGYTMDMQKKVRDSKYKLGLLKPDTFAEDRLLRQPPGVCIMLVMYNRYHNYAATQLRRINENGRFSVPDKYQGTHLEAAARYFSDPKVITSPAFVDACRNYSTAWKAYEAEKDAHAAEDIRKGTKPEDTKPKNFVTAKKFHDCEATLQDYIAKGPGKQQMDSQKFEAGYHAAWDKLDDDLFNTARLITSGLYIQVAIHDYLRALMGFHQYNTNFTLDPRMDIGNRAVSRGIGNQVTVEFNLLYRFHCAITQNDESYTEDYMRKFMFPDQPHKDVKQVSLQEFIERMRIAGMYPKETDPSKITFGIPDPKKPEHDFQRDPVTGLFDDQKMMDALTAAMDDPISNFGPRNIPRCLRPVEIMGMMQARKWEVGTLNDFREFFSMPRHTTFESITGNVEIQNALRDLYENPDKVELYPGIFCESDAKMDLDPGPSDTSSALWAAIFSDAITLVRSDRFYTVDWNTNSLTSWGMKEVTEDNDICKSSVFYRLLQRAFPGWFPYDSIRFFHPFYTAQQNARYAKEQGYQPDFQMSKEPVGKDELTGKPVYDVSGSVPSRPKKPVHVYEADRINQIMSDESGDFLHPALRKAGNFPPQIQSVLSFSGRPKKPGKVAPTKLVHDDPQAMMAYFTELMRYIVKRESITMTETTYQLDATRDFAIPVTTKYVADFLGFGYLVQSEKRPNAPHSENEIYQHITNCHVFLSYNADETKLMKRRKAFKASMEVLYKLTLNGSVHEASRGPLSKALFGKSPDNPMSKLGLEIAQHVLKNERDTSKAAAVLVFAGLHIAYNSVLAFSSVLNRFLKEMYDDAKPGSATKVKPIWLEVQDLALKDDNDSFARLSKIVASAERTSIKLPIIRYAVKAHDFIDKAGEAWSVEKGDTIILDIYRANVEAVKLAEAAGRPAEDVDFLMHEASVTDQFADYDTKKLAAMSVTMMIKIVAQMKNARRGHDAQGHLKKVNIDASDEGYSNFMAPMRMARIARQTQMMKQSDNPDAIYTPEILRPATDTFLTPEWDEMVPFPNTWKIRFDGFGKSDYSKDVMNVRQPYGALQVAQVDVEALAAPPFYQPQGLSHFGGSFADVTCVCNSPGIHCLCKHAAEDKTTDNEGAKSAQKPLMQADIEATITKGCGMGH